MLFLGAFFTTLLGIGLVLFSLMSGMMYWPEIQSLNESVLRYVLYSAALGFFLLRTGAERLDERQFLKDEYKLRKLQAVLRRENWVTVSALIFINVFFYILCNGTQGFLIKTPGVHSMFALGGNYTEVTMQGDYWRLLMANFLHYGPWMLFLNMYLLWKIGPQLDRFLGSFNFFWLYVFSGVVGMLASTAHLEDAVIAGSSGSLFGCMGAFLLMQMSNSGLTRFRLPTTTMVVMGLFLVESVSLSVSSVHFDILGYTVAFLSGTVFAAVFYAYHRSASETRMALTSVIVLAAVIVRFHAIQNQQYGEKDMASLSPEIKTVEQVKYSFTTLSLNGPLKKYAQRYLSKN